MRRQGLIIGGGAAVLLGLLPYVPVGAAPEGATPTCNGVAATMVVDSTGPLWEGTEQRDVIVVVGPISLVDVHGLGGNDLICGGSGSDAIDGGQGRDTIFGGGGRDCIAGESAAVTVTDNQFSACEQTLVVTGDDDELHGGGDNDWVYGNVGEDELFGDGGNDWLKGGDQADLVNGGSGNDDLLGGSGADELRAYTGNDDLLGGSGRDDLFGGEGSDDLDGGSGNDFCDGGPGTDTTRSC